MIQVIYKIDYHTHRTDVLNKLKQKINQDILDYKKVECIGYYIPDIEFSNVINETSSMIIRENKVDFDFQGPTFSGKANFSYATSQEEQTSPMLNSQEKQTSPMLNSQEKHTSLMLNS